MLGMDDQEITPAYLDAVSWSGHVLEPLKN